MISLYELLEASNGQLFGKPAAQIFEDLCFDVDEVQPNTLFVARQSDQGDTHQFIPRAIERGATGIVCSQPPGFDAQDVSVLLVRDPIEALLAWSHYQLGKLGTKVIAVAGTAGKSLAVQFITSVLETKYAVYTREIYGDGVQSIPRMLTRIKPEHRFAVVKLPMDQPGTMIEMVQAIQPDAGVVTHVGDIYSKFYDSPQAAAREIGLLIEYLSPSGFAALNYDDDLVRSMASASRAPVRTFGLDNFGADLMAYNISILRDSTNFDLRYGASRLSSASMALLGKYNLYSLLAALLIGDHYGVHLESALNALAELRSLPGRMNPLEGINGSLLVDDSYSANPLSTLTALEWLQGQKSGGGRKFFVFGGMDDLDEMANKAHQRIGKAAAEFADVVITQGPLAAISARAALDSGMPAAAIHMTYTWQDTVNILRERYVLRENDLVLVKGGATAQMEHAIEPLLSKPDQSRLFQRPHTLEHAISFTQPSRLSWLELDMDAFANNVRLVKAHVGESVNLMAVVKADAYGHGAVACAQTALLNGAGMIGVSNVQEALELRAAGITAPVLTMNITPTSVVHQAIQYDLSTTVFDLGMAAAFDRVARGMRRKLKVHLKIDSGMGRMGVLPRDAMEFCRQVLTLRNLEIEGVYTHFSTADEDPAFVRKQLAIFKTIVSTLQANLNLKIPYVHSANSAATMSLPETHLDLVRVGLALYGLHPSERVRLPEGFRPVMRWKTFVAQVKQLPAGHAIGYGNTYITEKPERVAVLPIGYADGFRRAPNSWAEVLIRGQRVPLRGRISMEKAVVSVDNIPEVAVGDEVVLLGRQGDEEITAEEIAAKLNTINYEVTCSILPRLARR